MRYLISFAVVALALVPAPADAARLTTGAIRVGDGGQALCEMVNSGTKDLRSVTGKFFRSDGFTLTEPEADLAPGEFIEAIGASNTSGASLLAWCEFNFKGSKRAFRGTLCIRQTGSRQDSCSVVLEAR